MPLDKIIYNNLFALVLMNQSSFENVFNSFKLNNESVRYI